LSICSGVINTFTATPVNGGALPAYQWRVNGLSVGSSSNAYSYIPASGDVVSVKLVSSAACAMPDSAISVVTMTVSPTAMPVVSINPTPGTSVCEGTMVTFTATPFFGGSSPVFNWTRNGMPAGSGSTFSYVPNNGDAVYCTMTSNYACRTLDTGHSSTVNMVVDTPLIPSVSIAVSPGTVLAPGQTATFIAMVTSGGPTPVYQWHVNGAAILGATAPVFTAGGFNNGDSVTCKVLSSGPCGGLSTFNSVALSVRNTGVADVTSSTFDVRVMPNPTKGSFIVKGTTGLSADEEVTIEMTDMLGRTIYSARSQSRNGQINEQIQLDNNLANGMYMLSLRSASGSTVLHVVKEN
jgi:hypothetical protein